MLKIFVRIVVFVHTGIRCSKLLGTTNRNYLLMPSGIVNNNKTITFFIIKLMQYKDTTQEAFLIIYLICILSTWFIYLFYSLVRSRYVSHLKSRAAHKKVWAPLTKINGRSQQAF